MVELLRKWGIEMLQFLKLAKEKEKPLLNDLI